MAVTVLAVLVRGRWPGFAAAWACYLILLGPNLGLAGDGHFMAADRYGYVPMMSLTAASSYLFARAWDFAGRRGLAAVWWALVGIALAGFDVATARQCSTWHETEGLWARVIARGGADDARSRVNHGRSLERLGRRDEALAEYVEAERLDPPSTQP